MYKDENKKCSNNARRITKKLQSGLYTASFDPLSCILFLANVCSGQKTGLIHGLCIGRGGLIDRFGPRDGNRIHRPTILLSCPS